MQGLNVKPDYDPQEYLKNHEEAIDAQAAKKFSQLVSDNEELREQVKCLKKIISDQEEIIKTLKGETVGTDKI